MKNNNNTTNYYTAIAASLLLAGAALAGNINLLAIVDESTHELDLFPIKDTYATFNDTLTLKNFTDVNGTFNGTFNGTSQNAGVFKNTTQWTIKNNDFSFYVNGKLSGGFIQFENIPVSKNDINSYGNSIFDSKNQKIGTYDLLYLSLIHI